MHQPASAMSDTYRTWDT